MSSGALIILGGIFIAIVIGSVALAPYRRRWVIGVRLLVLFIVLMFSVFGFLASYELGPGRERDLYHLCYGAVIAFSVLGMGLGVRALVNGS